MTLIALYVLFKYYVIIFQFESINNWEKLLLMLKRTEDEKETQSWRLGDESGILKVLIHWYQLIVQNFQRNNILKLEWHGLRQGNSASTNKHLQAHNE